MSAAPGPFRSRFTEARFTLLTAARFGDPRAIEARDLLREIVRCQEAIDACPHEDSVITEQCLECDVSGRVECPECGHWTRCAECNGTGKSLLPCDCIARFPVDVVEEAFGGRCCVPEQLRDVLWKLNSPRALAATGAVS